MFRIQQTLNSTNKNTYVSHHRNINNNINENHFIFFDASNNPLFESDRPQSPVESSNNNHVVKPTV